MPSSRPYAVGDRIWYIYGEGYSSPVAVPGTVTAILPASPGGQLQDKIEVELDDGRRCGGPPACFRPIPPGLGRPDFKGGRHHASA